MGKSIVNWIRRLLIALVALVFVATTLGSAQAGTFKIAPKGQKKIKIAILDLISSIEVSAQHCALYRKYAKERGWTVDVFDLQVDQSKAQSVMDNIITAGYDAVIVNWVDFSYYDQQILRAYKQGIPVQGIACGTMFPGVVHQVSTPDGTFGNWGALALVAKLHQGDKVIVYYQPTLNLHRYRFAGAKSAFEEFRITIAQELHYPGSGDPMQTCYDAVKSVLLADSKKEIKGIWTPWEGYGRSAARAAMDAGRRDFLSATVDDLPQTYRDLYSVPTLYATCGSIGNSPQYLLTFFKNLDIIFAGKPFDDQSVSFASPYLVTKDNLPPLGYYYNPCGYKGRAPDFKAK